MKKKGGSTFTNQYAAATENKKFAMMKRREEGNLKKCLQMTLDFIFHLGSE
jgi:hypothetical protein